MESAPSLRATPNWRVRTATGVAGRTTTIPDGSLLEAVDDYEVYTATQTPQQEVTPEEELSADGTATVSAQPLTHTDIEATPGDILAIQGPTAVQEYIVNEVQDVYRLQGVKINDKHFEVIVRQMMRKVEILDPGDTLFLEQQVVDKLEVMDENDRLWGKVVVVDAGDSETLSPGQIVTLRKLRDENSQLKRRDLRTVEVREAKPADGSSDPSGDHPRCSADEELHVGCFLPGNDEGSQPMLLSTVRSIRSKALRRTSSVVTSSPLVRVCVSTSVSWSCL